MVESSGHPELLFLLGCEAIEHLLEGRLAQGILSDVERLAMVLPDPRRSAHAQFRPEYKTKMRHGGDKALRCQAYFYTRVSLKLQDIKFLGMNEW